MEILPAEGDIVRFELPGSGLWFYCRVDDVLEDGALECRLVEAQSWPDVVLAEKRPGETLRMHARDVLSIVHPAHRGG